MQYNRGERKYLCKKVEIDKNSIPWYLNESNNKENFAAVIVHNVQMTH